MVSNKMYCINFYVIIILRIFQLLDTIGLNIKEYSEQNKQTYDEIANANNTNNTNNLVIGANDIPQTPNTNTNLTNIINLNNNIELKAIKNLKKPYYKAIRTIQNLKKFKVPFEKMLLIAGISNEITHCVNEFWQNHLANADIPQNLLSINADELMTIFIYIIMKSQLAELIVHGKLIKEFTTTTTKSSMVGYYYTTIEASLIFINSVENKNEFISKKDLKKTPNRSFSEEIKEEFNELMDDLVDIEMS